jgi:hypothetical protein
MNSVVCCLGLVGLKVLFVVVGVEWLVGCVLTFK